jgi:MFS transporter, DHA1 family, inner membrane transport protein
MAETDTTTPTDWMRLFLLLSVGVAAAFQIGKVPPTIPLLRHDFGMSIYTVGFVISAFNIMGVLLSPIVGSISDWLWYRRVIITGLSFLSLGSLAGSLTEKYNSLLITRFFEGFGYILVVVSAPGLISRVVQAKDRRLAFGIWSCFMPVGIAVMVSASPFLSSNFGWRGVWRFNALFLFTLIIFSGMMTTNIVRAADISRFSIIKILSDIWLTIKSIGPVILAMCFTAYTFNFKYEEKFKGIV